MLKSPWIPAFAGMTKLEKRCCDAELSDIRAQRLDMKEMH